MYIIWICLAAITWGTTGTTLVLLNQTVETAPLTVGFWRIAIASPLLLTAASRTPGFWQRPTPAESVAYLSLGGCMATFQLCYFNAVPLAGIAITAIVAICSSPLFITFIAVWKLGEQLSTKDYVALAVGIVGTVLLVAGPLSEPSSAHSTGRQNALGIGLALVAGLAYALYVIVSKVSIRQTPPIKVAAFGFSSAALWLLPAWIVASTTSPLAEPASQTALGTPDWLLALPFLFYLGAITTALSYATFLTALRYVPATTAGILTLIEPLTATLLGVFVFKESLGQLGVIGAGLLIGAIALLTLKQPSFK